MKKEFEKTSKNPTKESFQEEPENPRDAGQGQEEVAGVIFSNKDAERYEENKKTVHSLFIRGLSYPFGWQWLSLQVSQTAKAPLLMDEGV